jgi:hypothetical protein
MTGARTIDWLWAHEGQLHGFGVAPHRSVRAGFSGRRSGRQRCDVLTELDRDRAMGIFDYVGLKIYTDDVLGEPGTL